MYLLGYDLGSSSVKAALVDADTRQIKALVKYPEIEMEISSLQHGWAEQDPENWWCNVIKATEKLLDETSVNADQIGSIGISYQMHGLVLVDKEQKVLRSSIIWCDSRAAAIGHKAFDDLGHEYCLSHYLNSPGNFTASKLKWVRDNEPEIYEGIHKIMLPGDYLAMKLSGEISTTLTGLSEGVFWDFQENGLASKLMGHYGIDADLIPPVVDNFKVQSVLNPVAAEALSLKEGTPISYRAGDQPNNALSLSVFEPGEVAATGGTSGVVYAVTDDHVYDTLSRINAFAHVNHKTEDPRIGLLLCINGAGIQYSWIRKQMAEEGISYSDIEKLMDNIPVGSDGLRILPFGNGAERIFENRELGAQFNNLQFNRHDKRNFYRASLEGVAFSFVYGFEILKQLGVDASVIKVGNDNLFQSTVFSSTIANLLGLSIEMYNTTGAAGAAIASGIAIGQYTDLKDAFSKQDLVSKLDPNIEKNEFQEAFNLWKKDLDNLLKS